MRPVLLRSLARLQRRWLSALPVTRLPYNGAQVDVAAAPRLCDDTALFTTRLWETVAAERARGTDALFLRVPMLYAHLIPGAGSFGFRFHHAIDQTAVLLLWLGRSENKVPDFATHHCGVGGMVLDESGRVLLVRETHKSVGWKLPGGYLCAGEDIEAGVCREVFEETGVRASFERVLAFRHQHDVQFGRSDLYVVCQLRADSHALTVDAEIEAATWMPLADFAATVTHPMLAKVVALVQSGSAGMTGERMESVVSGKQPYTLYSAPSVPAL